jgi:hypothetical protein
MSYAARGPGTGIDAKTNAAKPPTPGCPSVVKLGEVAA